MKRVLIVVAVFAALCVVGMLSFMTTPAQHFALAQAGPGGYTYIATAAVGSDPCQNPSVVKQSVKVAIASATTTEILAPVAGKVIYVCRVLASVVGTSPTIQFTSGTKVTTACDTNPVTITGAVAVATTTVVNWGGAETVINDPVATELCLVSGGTAPSIQGWIDYVQQ